MSNKRELKESYIIAKAFEEAVKNSFEKNTEIQSIAFEDELKDKEKNYYSAVLDFGDFKERITYYSFMFLETNFVDVTFNFNKCEIDFTLYDVFNLFETDDYNLYYYSDCNTEEEIKIAVNDIRKATDAYFSDISRIAQNDDLLQELAENHKKDLPDEEDKDNNVANFICISHPLFSCASMLNPQKALKKLEKKNDKGKLDTIYEKRILKYLQSGKTLNRPYLDKNKDFENEYRAIKKRIFSISYAVFALIDLLLIIIARAILFNGAYVPREVLTVFGFEIPYLRFIALVAMASLLQLVVFKLGFGKKLISRMISEENKKRATQRFESEMEYKGSSGLTVFGGIAFAVICCAVLYLGVSDIGFFDTYARFFDNNGFSICTVDYDDVRIYKLKYQLESPDDDEEDLNEYENAYAIADENGHYYELGELLPNGKTHKAINDISQRYGKEIIEINSVWDIK